MNLLKFTAREDAIRKTLFLVSYVIDQCKAQQMCDKAISENGGTLIFFPDC